MLSNPLQRFSPYNNVSSSGLVSNDRLPPTHLQTGGLDAFRQEAHYTFQHLQQSVPSPGPLLARAGPHQKHRQHPYGAAGGKVSGASSSVRRRISRACDQCNQLRTKCDGQHPCAHCLEFGLGCEYVRERKKRGKASRKDLAQAAAQAAASTSNSGLDGSGHNGASSESSDKSTATPRPNGRTSPSSKGPHETSRKRRESLYVATGATSNAQSGNVEQIGDGAIHPMLIPQSTMDQQLENPPSLDLNGYGSLPDGYDRQNIGSQMMGSASTFDPTHGGVSSYPDLPYGLPSQSPTHFGGGPGFRLNGGPLSTYSLSGNATSPGWGVAMSSPNGQYRNGGAPSIFNYSQLRYPVLEPLLPHLDNILPITLACDLIDLYFASSSSAQMHPESAYVLGFVFRKKSFLHPTRPRQCQPALLASMLWVAAQTSDSPFLTSVPSGRGKVCQKLLELTVSLLKPLIHTPSGDLSPVASPVAEGVALGGLGVALPGTMNMNALTGKFGAFGAAGSLDDVITYMHLATVVSASEYKGASLRWWNAAWSLARELKLGRELPPGETPMDYDETLVEDGIDEHDLLRNRPGYVTEEEREERRRIWWLVYIVDRHLALCYNRPLFLLDIECDGLQHPIDDTRWQSGDFSTFNNGNTDPSMLRSGLHGSLDGANEDKEVSPAKGPSFECRGHSIFGYFLPLMTILGEIVDLHHARNHPRFGVAFRPGHEWDDQADEITKHLQTYERSLSDFQQRHLSRHAEDSNATAGTHDGPDGVGGDTGTPHSVQTTSTARLTESDVQTRIVVNYGTHVVHVLHILLAGKWDPINLIDDNDLWISTQGFISATSHAVEAAEAINQILEYDPGLEFMPFFFGIYLLQGSFLLLLIADKLQFEASSNVVRACETIVRAHEACVVTLNTEYQRNFSKVMRSALAQVRGRMPEDLGEQHHRRRELLSLYRWTGDGTGLAL